MNRTPDMSGKASEITDPIQLCARLGYHVYVRHQAEQVGETSKVTLYDGYIASEIRALTALYAPLS
jgi:hypothetical protein